MVLERRLRLQKRIASLMLGQMICHRPTLMHRRLGEMLLFLLRDLVLSLAMLLLYRAVILEVVR